MAVIDIYKASAGSGKTHTLTQKYLQYLLQSDDADAYRHILAVTFTNKATDEMKQRVLDTLSKEARKDSPDGRKARRVLISILHDYSNFSITTIDKFFLQIIRAFAREIGQNGSSRVELDEQGVIASAVDSMLDSLDEEQNAPLLDWMVAYALESVEKGGSYDIATSLKEFSKLFLQEDFRIKKGMPGVSFVQDRETIEEVRKLTAARMKAFREKYPPRSRNVDEYAKRVNETDKIIMDSVGIMGISSDIYARMTEILREKNLVMLSESKETIRKLIDDSDAPFIYEKVGNRYDHLMLDEFQDTSRVEWSNFLPLYRESLAKGKDCMIVGDIKQSIYRFRGSDWETLNSGLARDFDSSLTHFDTLKVNRRSARNIIGFNNLLYKNIKQWLPDEFAQKISDIYKDAEQTEWKEAEGYVKVQLVDYMSKPEFVAMALDWMMPSIRELQANGFPAGSITVLARDNKQVSDIAKRLIAEGYAVITDESLLVSGCPQVQKLVAVLKYLSSGTDDICNEQLRQLGVDLSRTVAVEGALYDLCENIIRIWVGEVAKGDIPYINAFLDIVTEYTSVYGSDVAAFVRWWEESASKNRYISVPEGKDAVRVMTYHKSKGLSLEAVVIPFFNEPFSSRKTSFLWTTPPPEVCKIGLFPVKCVKDLDKTFFSEDYRKESFLKAVDAMNAAYVATTRAKQAMYINAVRSKEGIDAVSESLAQMLEKSCKPAEEGGNVYEFGTPQRYVPSSDDADARIQEPVDSFVSIPYMVTEGSGDEDVPVRPRIEMAYSGADFFAEPGARQKGVVLHDILAAVSVPEDLPQAVVAAVADGVLPAAEAPQVEADLSQAIASVAALHWFDSGSTVYNELSIINTDGNVERPDRVIMRDGETIVVDYKFGEERKGYRWQVGRYMKLLKLMGHSRVKGYIWYVKNNKVEEI